MPDTVSTRQSDAPHCALSRARRSHALDLRRSRPARGILGVHWSASATAPDAAHLAPRTTKPARNVQVLKVKPGCRSRTRTYDPLINSQLLYRLSYAATRSK